MRPCLFRRRIPSVNTITFSSGSIDCQEVRMTRFSFGGAFSLARVQQLHGHKKLKNTVLYTQLIDFESDLVIHVGGMSSNFPRFPF